MARTPHAAEASDFRHFALRILTITALGVALTATACNDERAPSSDTDASTLDGGADGGGDAGIDIGGDIGGDTTGACAAPNPVGCTADAQCDDGERCIDDGECRPSSCVCDDLTGTWICTEDCGGGVCSPVTSHCSTDDECPAPFVCEDGNCNELDCPDLWAPVCGDDGITYANPCEARRAHADVVGEGACLGSGCGTDEECVFGSQYCEDETCVPCPDFDCAACPPGYDPVTRNGCYVCACEPVRDCESDFDCGLGGRCVGLGTCTDLCRDGDPACCEASVCEYDGACEGRNPAGCINTGCADGYECDTRIVDGCVPSFCECDAATGSWACTEDCGGGLCVPRSGGCASDRDCRVGQFCLEGVCVDGGCGDIWDPVCGVDGRTYSNPCEANLAHVDIAYRGECVADACVTDWDCPIGEVCDDGGCVDPGCTRVYLPVCGVDGATYGNSCLARISHVEVAYEGECTLGCMGANPQGCSATGCRRGEACVDLPDVCVSSGCSCDTSTGAWVCLPDCGGGVCVPTPSDCADDLDCDLGQVCVDGACTAWGCPDVWSPVCGVDGRTYGNICEARVAHVEVAYSGACTSACDGPNPAGCRTTGCEDGQECVSFDGGVCIPSFCECDPATGGWSCTDDCSGGVCVPTAIECTRDIDCGFDRVCVGNMCVSIDADMCVSNSDCPRSRICYPPTNTCEPVCAIDCLVPDFVCGDDGVTYSCGEVDAWCHGAEVVSRGGCTMP